MIRRVLSVSLAVLLGAACVSTPKQGGGSVPTMLTRSRAEWRVPSGRRTGVVVDLRVEVRVGADGKPDMQTLTVTGLGASENRDVAAEWLQESRFQPALKDGQPVAGTFKTRVQLRGEVRRVGG